MPYDLAKENFASEIKVLILIAYVIKLPLYLSTISFCFKVQFCMHAELRKKLHNRHNNMITTNAHDSIIK